MSVGEQTPSIFLVGAGRMGGALLRGWLAAGIEAGTLAVREPHPSPATRSLLAERGIPQNPRGSPDALVLAVKPQSMTKVLSEIGPYAGPGTIVISIAAGRTLTSMAAHLHPQASLVRAMPNLPAEVGRGITVACANANVTAEQRKLCDRLLQAVGQLAWIEDESLIDAVTAVSGSGPAYLFYLVECLARAGEAAGLPHALAMQLARSTVTGSAELLHDSQLSPRKLRENVTSPGGTTAAGLSVLTSENGLERLMIETVEAAANRSRQLSE